MARSKAQLIDDTTGDAVEISASNVSTSPEGWEWDTVASEAGTKVIFDEIGDVFVGQFVGVEHIAPEGTDKDGKPKEPFDLYMFRGVDDELYSINSSYALVAAMANVEKGQWCRLTYVKNVEVAGRPEPMKSFRVEVRKV